MDPTLVFYVLLFSVAFLYASVGHGGASGYLALMALFSMTPEIMKPTALLLNIFVAGTAFVQFYRAGHFRAPVFWPIALASVPMAFVGGLLEVDGQVYRIVLGILLLVAAARFFFFRNIAVEEMRAPKPVVAVLIGGSIGYLSGLIGIGGGIILSPVLLLLKWTDQKQTAAISALFIFVNSVAGLGGQMTKGIHFSPDMLTLVAIALAGGLAGAYLGSFRYGQTALKHVLATVLLMASCKLLCIFA